MSEFEDVLYEVDGTTAVVTINRPERHNAFRGQTIEELIAAFRAAWANKRVRAIVFTGAGDKAFCSGGDVKQRAETGDYGPTESGLWEINAFHKLIRDIPKPVIAAVNGVAIGGGHVFHVICDLTIASETARFGQAGPRVGSFDAGFGTGFLARVVGEKRAREIWYLCRQYDAHTAERWGLVNAVVPSEEVLSEAKRWAEEIAAMSPTAIRVPQAFLQHGHRPPGRHQQHGRRRAGPVREHARGSRGRARLHREAQARLRPLRMTITIDLGGEVAVVTGAASGIGRAIAVTLAEAGATVAAVDRNAEGVQATAEQIGGSAHATDLTDPAAILALRDEVIETHGVPGIVVNAAGWDRIEPFMANDDELWQTLTAINLLGPVRVSHALLGPIIDAGNGARIVNIASDAGRVGSTGETFYAGTKGGIIAFTKSLAREMARHRVNVNCVCPGPTDTPLLDSVPDKLRESLAKSIPFRRLAEPGEIADAVLFFVSDRARYVTGQTLSVSGGLTMAG
jgi:dihydroxynaphthoic acid synthetase